MKDEYGETLDPWGYETNPDDAVRKYWFDAYVGETSEKRVIDVGVGTGFLTRDLPATEFIGLDTSAKAVEYLRQYFKLNNDDSRKVYELSILDQGVRGIGKFDLVIATGVFYDFYVGASSRLLNQNIDIITQAGSELMSVHISEWRYVVPDHKWVELDCWKYPYRNYVHELRRFKRLA